MKGPYVYPHTNILKNKANIQDEEVLSCMEAEHTSLRLAELVVKESAGRFDFEALCDMHRYIFQDVYEWAGEIRVINIEKSEPALGGISIEYSEYFAIAKNVVSEYIHTAKAIHVRWLHFVANLLKVKDSM